MEGMRKVEENVEQRRARLIAGFNAHLRREFDRLEQELSSEENANMRLAIIAYRCLPKKSDKKDEIIEAFRSKAEGFSSQALETLTALENNRHQVLLRHGDSWENCIARAEILEESMITAGADESIFFKS